MKVTKQLKTEYYDHFYRDQESKKFYQSAQWRKVKEMKLSASPCCEACAQAGVTTAGVIVHHAIPINIKKGPKRLDMNFLITLCIPCHNSITAEMEKERNRNDGQALSIG